MSKGRSLDSSAIKSVLQKIQDGQFYDASQMVTILVNRFMTRGMDGESVRLCHSIGVKLVEANQLNLAANLGLLMIKTFTEFELPPTKERVQMILDLFTGQPSKPSDERSHFIEKAIKWASDNNADPVLMITLHRTAGESYQCLCQYGQAQGHMVFCEDGNLLASLIKEWKEKGYPSENELFVLRLILILLAKDDVSVAESVIESPIFGFNLECPTLPPALQLSYLLIEACKQRNVAFFDALQTKYMLVIRRDPGFKRLLQAIDQNVFGRKSQGSGSSMFGMLTSVLNQPVE